MKVIRIASLAFGLIAAVMMANILYGIIKYTGGLNIGLNIWGLVIYWPTRFIIFPLAITGRIHPLVYFVELVVQIGCLSLSLILAKRCDRSRVGWFILTLFFPFAVIFLALLQGKMGYFEVKVPEGEGRCSDNTCPCGEPGALIPRGTGHLYISQEAVRFRRDCRTQQQFRDKMKRIQSRGEFHVFASPELIAPILVCDQSTKLQGLSREVATSDAKYWWETGLVPLRPTPSYQQDVTIKASQERPWRVTFIAIGYFMFSAIFAIIPLIFAATISGDISSRISSVVIGLMFGLILAALGYGMWTLKLWAYHITYFLGLPLMLAGYYLGALLRGWLRRDEVRQVFGFPPTKKSS